MESHDIRKTLGGLDEMSFGQLEKFSRGHVSVFSSTAGTSPWERHPDADEFLQILEGEEDPRKEL